MLAYAPNSLMTLGIATLFAGIFLFGGRLAYRPGQRGRRRFLSFAAGISVAYTFVHILPALREMGHLAVESPSSFRRMFPEYSVYLWSMAGFLVFYGLETMMTPPGLEEGTGACDDGRAAPWQQWIHIGGFAVYAWLLAYLMVWADKSALTLCLYAVAMGMHIVPIAGNLNTHYHPAYHRLGASLLAFACLAGWACGIGFDVPVHFLVNLTALVAGGVIVNTAIAELPKEREGRFWSFFAGATVYTALLLTLSHLEKPGEL